MANILTKDDILADLHTHTIFSKHGHSTLFENAVFAGTNNMKYMATTDHMYNSSDIIEYKNELTRLLYIDEDVNDFGSDVQVINGCEFNLNHMLHDIKNIKNFGSKIKWKLLGLHSWFLDPSSVSIFDIPMYFKQGIQITQANTDSQNYDVTFIKPTAFAHIERELSSCQQASVQNINECLADIVNIAEHDDIVLEINESSLRRNENDNVQAMKFWINYAKDRNVMFSLGSDAHYCTGVGRFDNAIDLINSIGIPKNRIINTIASELKALHD